MTKRKGAVETAVSKTRSNQVRKRSSAVLVLSSSGYVTVLQIAPILVLDALEFGYYSIIQLLSILGASVSLSLINEADVRRRYRGFKKSSWKDFSATALWLSLVFFVVALIISLLTASLADFAFWWAFGVGLSVYRGTARYRLTQEGQLSRLVVGDITSVLFMLIAGGLLLWARAGSWSLTDILTFWLGGIVVSVLFTKLPTSINPKRMVLWHKKHSKDILVLLPDSALQDVGAFWGPTLIAAILDVASLGIYRAVTIFAAPVRLILTPLRPLFTRDDANGATTWRIFAIIQAIGILLGGVAIFGLLVLKNMDYDFGVLSHLVPFAFPVAIYIAGNFTSHYFSVHGRVRLSSLKLILTRLLQSLALGLAPVAAALVSGLAGAIWTLSVGSFLIGIVWFIMLYFHRSSSCCTSSNHLTRLRHHARN